MYELFMGYLPIIVVLVLIVICYFLLQTKYKKEIAVTLLYLVTQAETEFGANTGELKYSAVATWLYEKLPFTARLFLSTTLINQLIEDAVEQMKLYLEQNAEAKALVSNTI